MTRKTNLTPAPAPARPHEIGAGRESPMTPPRHPDPIDVGGVHDHVSDSTSHPHHDDGTHKPHWHPDHLPEG